MTNRRYKRVAIEEEKLDRLSDLPVNVINLIQEYVDLDDAARMSILSRKWRYVWASHPKLLIYEQFCRKRNQSGIINVINKILSLHSWGGPIKTFFLDITPISFSDHSVLDQWMLFLSRNGLLKLILKHSNDVNALYKFPSYVYGIELLRHLYLSNCVFQPPSCNFRGFPRLENISLSHVIFDLDNESTSCFVLCLPILKKLSFVRCRGLCRLNIHAPELVSFAMSGRGSGSFNLVPILNCQKLDEFLCYPQEEVSQNDEVNNMPKLPIVCPKIRHFGFDQYSLKCWASGIVAEWLPTSFNILHLCDLDLNNKEQVCSLVCLLRSCPNLRSLCVGEEQ